MIPILNLYQGEQKVIKISIVDKITHLKISLTGCIFSLRIVNENKTIEKADEDFDKTQVADGTVKFSLDDDDLDTLGRFEGQLKIIFLNGEIDKSNIFYIYIAEAI